MPVQFYYCFKLLSFIGVHPRYKFRRPLIFLNILAVLCLFSLVLLKLYLEPDLDSIESFFSISLISIKYVVLILKRDLIKRTLTDIDHFWKDESNDSQINTLTKYLAIGEKLYTIFVFMGFLGFVAKPFVLTGSSIFGCYVPPEIPYPVFYFLELYVMMLGLASYGGFNMLICSSIILVVLQFRLLSIHIKALNLRGATESTHHFKICLKDLKRTVAYHNFLITCVQNLNKILSLPIFILMVASVTLLCVNLYIITLTEATNIDFIRIGLTSFAMISEFLFIYGLPAQLLMDEAMEISNTVYCECDWYLPNITPVRKYLLMIMLRSQRKLRITAENFITINNQTVVLLLKTAYSFYTFLQTVT